LCEAKRRQKKKGESAMTEEMIPMTKEKKKKVREEN